MDYNKKLIGHLMSEDFFAVESHPLATFEATNLNWSDKDKKLHRDRHLDHKGYFS